MTKKVFYNRIIRWQESEYFHKFQFELEKNLEQYSLEREQIINQLQENEKLKDETARIRKVIKQVYDADIKYFGFYGWLIETVFAFCSTGNGEIEEWITNELGEVYPKSLGTAIMEYVNNDIDMFLEEISEIIAKYDSIIENDFEDRRVREMIEKIKDILGKHFGVNYKWEYDMIFDYFEVEKLFMGSKYGSYVVGAMKYYNSKDEMEEM